MTYNWCHGPSCHERSTLDRIRGSKGNKVLRTRKIKVNYPNEHPNVWDYFCNQSCLFGFINHFLNEMVNINKFSTATCHLGIDHNLKYWSNPQIS